MVSQTVEYALRAMGHLAVLDGVPATAQSIASMTSVPQGYLSKIMRDLVCAQLVRSFRGRRGGFVLARPAARISVLDIVNAVDPIRRIECCPMGNPLHISLCPIHRCLDDALGLMEDRFRSATLVSVVDASQDGSATEHGRPRRRCNENGSRDLHDGAGPAGLRVLNASISDGDGPQPSRQPAPDPSRREPG